MSCECARANPPHTKLNSPRVSPCKLSNLTRVCAAMHQTTGTERNYTHTLWGGYSCFFPFDFSASSFKAAHHTTVHSTHSQSLTFRFNSIYFFICLPFLGRWPARRTHIISISLHLIRDIIIIINEWYSPRSGYGDDSGVDAGDGGGLWEVYWTNH